MKDQEREAEGATEFKEQYSHYAVSMKMETKDRLLIEVEDTITFEKWKKIIDNQFIGIQAQEEPLYLSIFAQPELIYDFLTKNFSEVAFKPDMFSFAYSYGPARNRKTKIMTIQLEKEEEKSINDAQVMIDKMKYEFIEKLAQRDTKIKFLEENIVQIKDLLFKMATEVRQLTARITKEQENNKILEEKCIMIHQRLEKQEGRSKRLEERLKNEEESGKILEEKLEKQHELIKKLQDRLKYEEENSKRLQKMLQRDQEKIILPQMGYEETKEAITRFEKFQHENKKYCQESINNVIAHHLDNPHSQYYDLNDCTATSAKLTMAGNDCYNFVNRTEVLSKLHNKYAVRILKATDSYLLIGFCTEKGLGVTRNYLHDESVYYYCQGDGRLVVNGVQKNLSDCGCVDGDVVEAVCDLLEGRVVWSKGGKLLAECAVPANMKGKPIYLSIILAYQGDAVEVTSF